MPELALLIRALHGLLDNLSRNNKLLPSSTSRLLYMNEVSDLLVILEEIRSILLSNATSSGTLPVPAILGSMLALCHSAISQHLYNILEAMNKSSQARSLEIPGKRKRTPWTSMRKVLRKQKDDIKHAAQFS